MRHGHRGLHTLAAIGLAGCLERDIAIGEALISDPSSTGASSSSSAPSNPSGPPVSTETGETAGGSSSSGESTSATHPPTDMTSTTDTSTGEPPAVCGDAMVAGEEECDDPADLEEDACTSTCFRPRLAFLTSEVFTGEDLDGLDGADNRCRIAAAMANLPADPGNFKAILSDSTTSANDRLHHSRGPYRLVNGLQIARDYDALMHEPLEHPLNTTELGTAGFPGAWTGTEPGGGAVAGSEHCLGWHSMSFNDLGSYGKPTQVDEQWLKIANEIVNPANCDHMYALYCLEQE
jgi:hypothetical protein